MKKLLMIFGIVIACAILALFPLIFNFTLMSWTTSVTYGFGESASWVSFFGSYFGCIFGGVIGGLFTYLGVKHTLNVQYKQKFVDDFPTKIKLLTDQIFKLNNIIMVLEKEDCEFIKGYAPYQSSGEFYYDMRKRAAEATENGTKADGELYEKLRGLSQEVDSDINKYQGLKLDEIIADDEYGTRSRLSEESVTLRKEAITTIKQVFQNYKDTFVSHQIKMEVRFKKFIKP